MPDRIMRFPRQEIENNVGYNVEYDEKNDSFF